MDAGKSINNTKKRVAVLWHQDQDGFGAAYAAWSALRDHHELLFIPVQYSQEPPLEELRGFAPDKVYIVDFSYKAPVLIELSSEFPNLVVIDHHKTAEKELEAWCDFGRPVEYSFDADYSGAVLTWMYLFPEDTESPTILQYVQDRDLWKFELPDSKAVNAYIATLPWDFEVWDNFKLEEALLVGGALVAHQKKQIAGRLRDVRMISWGKYEQFGATAEVLFRDHGLWDDQELFEIPIVNASENISELGEAMCEAYPDAPFSVSYCDRKDGKRSYSLRSRNGFDVSEVAKVFGGGGHFSASGFALAAPESI